MSAALPLVVVLDKGDASIEERILTSLCPGGFTLRALDLRTQESALADASIPAADVIIVWHTLTLNTELLSRMSRARIIVRVGVGYDNIDLLAAASMGLPVCNIPNYGTEEVADSAMSLILACFRRTVWAASAVASGHVAHGGDGVARLARGSRRLRGCVLGLLGCGRIGAAVALRAKAFGLDVVFYDPHVPAGYDKALGIRRVASHEELAAQAHCLSIHCDLNATSRNLVDGAFLRRMPAGGFVVNTARGGIIVEADLAACLASGHTAGAGIDVHEVEPYYVAPGAPHQPLASAPNCICTPHTAFYSDQGWVEMRELAATAAAHALRGTAQGNCVNARLLQRREESGLGAPRAPILMPRD